MNEPIDNLLPYQPSPDALAEVRVETNNYSAEFGNVAGAVIGSTHQVGHQRVPRERLRVLARQQHGREHLGQQPRDPAAKKAELSQHIFGAHHRRPDHEEQAVLLRRLPGLHPRPPGRAGRERRAGSLAPGRLLGRRRDHPRSRHRAAVPRQPDSHRAASARSRRRCWPTSSSTRCPTGPATSNNLVAPLLRQAARPSGRRQGRREPLDQRSHVRARSRTRTTSPSRSARRSRAT